jgi:hypothetical protein
MRRFALLTALLLLAVTFFAQESEVRGPDGGTRTRVEGIQILPVAGKPFSGIDSIDWTRTLEDGTVVSTHLEARLARDSQGRIYRERVSFVPANSEEHSKVREIIISDPTTHTRVTCSNATRHCNVTKYFAPTSFKALPTGPFDDGKRVLAREGLGSDTFDDLNVIGTRETITTAAGVVGNSSPLVTTREFWYSPDLEVNLSVTRKDPREGTQVIHVTNLSRSEPDAALFQVPSNYVIEDRLQPAKAAN